MKNKNFFTKEQKRNSRLVLILLGVLLFCAFTVSCTSKSGNLVKEREEMKAKMLSEVVFPLLSDAKGIPDSPELREKAEKARTLATYVLTKEPEGTTKKLLTDLSSGVVDIQDVLVTIPMGSYVYVVRVANVRDGTPVNFSDVIAISKERAGFNEKEQFIISDFGLNGHSIKGFVAPNLSPDGQLHRYDSENNDEAELKFFLDIYDGWIDLLIEFYEYTPEQQTVHVKIK